MYETSNPPSDLATEPPSTERQRAYLRSLLTEAGLWGTVGEDGRKLDDPRIAEIGKYAISKWIEKAKKRVGTAVRSTSTLAGVPAFPDVAEGWYAIEDEDGILHFYRVDRPEDGRWAGYTFVKEQASDDLYPVRGVDRKRDILAKIAADPRAALVRYGQEIGRCAICNRTLTNAISRYFSIGPVCGERCDLITNEDIRRARKALAEVGIDPDSEVEGRLPIHYGEQTQLTFGQES